MGKISNEIKFLISLWVVLILAIIFTYAHQGHLLIDCGREVYYPVQILQGKILYKDIFNIYGPFSYMFNASLFKLFGINLNVLYASGYLCSFVIVTLIYKLSRKFLPVFLSFAIGFYTIAVGVLHPHLFGFIFPYSYGMLYGTVAFLISVWFLLKYQESPEEILNLYLSCFWAGISFSNKYDFLLYFLVIIYSMFKIKPLNFKQYYFAMFSLLFMPVFCFGVLFLQGLSIDNLVSSAAVIKNMSQTQTLKYFYLTQGVYYHKKTPLFLLLSFLIAAIPFYIFLFGFKVKNKITSFVLISTAVVAMTFLTSPATFVFLPILLTILAVVYFKNIKNNIPLLILTLSAITLSLKVFWGLTTFNYGIYFVSFLLIALFALVCDRFKDKNIDFRALGYYVLILGMILAFQNIYNMRAKAFYLKTERGGIYLDKPFYDASSQLVNYINENTKKSDKILILPEGAFINFLTDRTSDDYYISLLPLYVETFGEENIINHFKKNKPDYIIFNNWNTKDYYFNYICKDYALSFCSFVDKNYKKEKLIDEGVRYLILKRK